MSDPSLDPAPPISGAASPAHCSECRFWEHRDDRDGYCKRSAQVPGAHENGIARWRQTHGADWCGEGMVRISEDVRVKCGACRFWFRPENGIEPLQYSDRFKDWWRGAGHCRRYAPQATSELGGRSFWPVTHVDDSCGDGRAKI
ncbi:MAG: hypothetical protein P4L76_11970 [Beijerinckiaceae bacterium]|nr:hypothetical protein [Beijerinckiaceae bacterium]